MKFLFLLILGLTCSLCPLKAATEQTDDKNGDGKADMWIEQEDEQILCLRVDSNFDGAVDYLLRTNQNKEKVYEEIDFNHDGSMDDFYFYSEGVLVRRELDSNYDGEVDVWVYLSEGVYIQRYARDRDYDGVIDLERDFTPGTEE